MAEPSGLSPLTKGELKVGVPLQFSVYDREGKLLLAAGQTLSERQLEELSSKGLYHNPRWMTPEYVRAKGSVAPDPVRTQTRPVVRPSDPSETGTVLKMSLNGSEESFVVRLLGSLEKEAFIVSHPMREGACIFVKEGQFWEFRAFYGLSVYRFTARVEKVLLSPWPLLLISWPQQTQLESRMIRAARRVTCEFPTSMRRFDQAAQDVFLNGMIENVSTGGVEFVSTQKAVMNRGELVQLAFQVYLGDRRFVLEPKAQVMSANRDSTGEMVRHGLAFVDLSDKDFSVIHAFVSDRLIGRLESPLYTR